MINRMMEKTRAAPQMIERSQATEESIDRGKLGQLIAENEREIINSLSVTAVPPELPSPPVFSDAGRARKETTEMAMKAPS